MCSCRYILHKLTEQDTYKQLHLTLVLLTDDGKPSTLPAAATSEVVMKVVAASLKPATLFNPNCMAPIIDCDIS